MKKLLLLCLLVSVGFAKSYIISPLPLPKQEILNLETEPCNKKCLLSLYEQEQYFSFVARFEDEEDSDLRAKLALSLQNLAILDIPTSPKNTTAKVKLGLLMPKKVIRHYFYTSIDTILSYLMARGGDFSFEVFNTDTEDTQAIESAYKRAIEAKSDFIIGVFTTNGAKELASNIKITTPIYLPTINIHQIGDIKAPKNLYFGGVDYESQIELLLHLSEDEKIVAYNDKSPTGQYLGELLRTKSPNVIFLQEVESATAKRFMNVLASQEQYLQDSVVIFNTQGARTGLMMSQIALSKAKPKKMLSTQVSYDFKIFDLVQPEDRKEFYVVSMIGALNPKIVEYTALLGRDLKYDWVNYSTAVGVELLLGAQIEERERYFKEFFLDNQVSYTNRVYKISGKSFYEYH